MQKENRLPPFKYHAVSDVGLFRENNEDAWISIPEQGIFIVADGLGGHQAGEVASKEALEEFHSHFLSLSKKMGTPKTCTHFEQMLLDSFYAANQQIFQLGKQHTLLRGMGTTFSLLAFFKKRAILLHVGDSRIYRYRSPKLLQLSEDHLGSRVSSLDEPRHTKGFLTKALGTAELILPQFIHLPCRAGDYFLLCSDGLSDLLSSKEIADVLAKETLRLEEKVRMLVYLAKANGGQDNVTVLLIHLPKEG